jgi:type VI secretion system secreted protein Hcp
MTIQTRNRFVAAAGGAILLVLALYSPAGPLDPSAPPASTMRSLQEIYDLTNSMKGAALPAPLTGPMTDMYLQLAGIPGESQSNTHENWIDAVAFHWGVSRPGQSFPIVGRPPTVVADHADLTIVKRIDKSSPKLFLACCSGQVIPEASFEVCRFGEYPATRIMLYKMTDVVISSVKPVGGIVENPGVTSGYLMEEVSLNYRQMELRYTGIGPDGKPEPDVVAIWDRQENRQL